jgi:hypothetical protein
MCKLCNPSDQDIKSQTPHNRNLVQLSMSVARTDNHVAKCDQLKNNWRLWGGGGSWVWKNMHHWFFTGKTIKEGNLENSVN